MQPDMKHPLHPLAMLAATKNSLPLTQTDPNLPGSCNAQHFNWGPAVDELLEMCAHRRAQAHEAFDQRHDLLPWKPA